MSNCQLKRNWFPPREASLKREQILNLVYHIHETDSQRAADSSCRCPCPSQIDDANKTENDVEILEKQGISARKSYGDSSLDTDCQKDVLPLADSQSKGSCLDGNLKGRPRKGRKSNLLLDIEVANTLQPYAVISSFSLMLYLLNTDVIGLQCL